VSPPLNLHSVEFAYFFFHTFLRNTSLRQLSARGKRPVLSTSSELFLGALAGGLAQIFTIPVAVIATRQQLWMPPPSAGAGKAAYQRAPTFAETAREVIAEGGPTALWTGLRPGLVLTVNPAITYGVFERAKSWVLSGERQGGKLGVAEAFWLGVMSKTLATVVTYPYIFVGLTVTDTIPKSRHSSVDLSVERSLPLIVVPRQKSDYKLSRPDPPDPLGLPSNPAEPHTPASLRPQPRPTRQSQTSRSLPANSQPRLNFPSTHRLNRSPVPREGLWPCSSRCIASKVSRDGIRVSERRSSKPYCAKVGLASPCGLAAPNTYPL
jgi:hypothetical protein